MLHFDIKDKILIVGGTGFIGQHVTLKCIQHTSHVTCLGFDADKNIPLFRGKEVEILRADLSDCVKLKSQLKDNAYDYVFNLGGYISHAPFLKGGRQVIETHMGGLMNLLGILDLKRLKGFVQVGTSDEYGSAPSPQKEEFREAPIAPYSVAKTASTHLIQALALTEEFPGVVVRPFLVYGPGQNEHRFLPQLIKGCFKNRRFPVSEGRQLRDFCFVEDVADGMIAAALTPSAVGKVFNIASGKPVSIREIIEKVSKIVGKGFPEYGEYPYRPGENMAVFADVSRANKELGWFPETILECGLTKTIDWYRDNL